MAISQIMSNPSDWLSQPYQSDFSITTQAETFPAAATSSGATATSAVATRNNVNNNLSPDQGRISKPLRRRARASRRTPTTLLSTDTTNFRAMVQHFTGGGATAAPTRPSAAAALNFSAAQLMMGPANANAAAGGFRMQYPGHQQQQQQQHMFMMDHNVHAHGGGGETGAARGSTAAENQNYGNYMM